MVIASSSASIVVSETRIGGVFLDTQDTKTKLRTLRRNISYIPESKPNAGFWFLDSIQVNY